ncbi:head GIN domain-containing protein [Larkinella soli]|uniref:head GIN domain-containing protein n=1 Tax=Larkinella soli TaxID=1770527 RepID=UPI0013E376C7|nr:head GIN domain-containing protein [Larkinella soli]
MKRLLLTIPILALLETSSLAQRITRQFTLQSFDRIDVANAIDVEIRKGAFDIVADLAPGETEYLSLKAENGVLTARFNRPAGSWASGKNRKSPRLLITLPSLRGITLSGASDGKVEESFSTEELEINLSGAADLKMENITAGRIRLKASGASDTRLQGRARRLEADLSGASDLKASDLVVEEAVVRAAGASDASVNVTRRLEKNTRGGADVTHRGNPQTVVSNQKKDED